MTITVWNIRDPNVPNGAVSIMRPCPVGNPFKLVSAGGTYTREDSVATYEIWLRKRLQERERRIVAMMNHLYVTARTTGRLDMVCCCAPAACHGDVIKQILEETLRKCKN